MQELNHAQSITLESDALKPLLGRNCLIGITGGIAAYKIPEVIRRLKDAGANVRVVMTQGALAFITPLTLQAVSGHGVSVDLLDERAEAAMGHIELAKWADLVVVAPATADFIGRLHAGLANDLLTTLCLATSSEIALVPAMNQQMYQAPMVQRNLKALAQYPQFLIWGPAIGAQACGDVGAGRMIEPSEIVAHILAFFQEKQEGALSADPTDMALREGKRRESYPDHRVSRDLEGMRIMITAGPTREAIDPVRYISNHSSGKMGYAIAKAAVARGAQVTLISGPVNLPMPKGVVGHSVISAQEMYETVHHYIQDQTLFIGTAAVADYRLEQIGTQKMKKQSGSSRLELTLVQNPDIIHSVAMLSKNRPYVVGFAAETQDVITYAKDKLVRKQLDMICANDVSDPNIGFNSDHNHVVILTQNGEPIELQATKLEIADALLTHIKKQVVYPTDHKE